VPVQVDHAYREYFLACEKLADLSDTVGVTEKEWDRAQTNFQKALDKCNSLEEDREANFDPDGLC